MHIIIPSDEGRFCVLYVLPPHKGGFFMGKLIEQLIGDSSLIALKNKMTSPGGRLIDGQSISRFGERLLGEFSERALLESPDISTLLPSETTTALGGWCVLRTADSLLLSRGIISDPETGEKKAYTTLAELTNWITSAVSLDQIVGAIGIFTGKNYTAISEERLWTDRIFQMAARNISLSPSDIKSIREAVEKAEIIRLRMTERYIRFVSKRSPRLVRVIDEDIFPDLRTVRDEMLDAAGISIPTLQQMFSNESGIDSYSIVWAMYTGPYLELLKRRKYVTTEKAVLLEPSDHAVSETQAKSELTTRYFGDGRNRYLNEEGPNRNLGFIPFLESMEPDGKTTKRSLAIGQVPNTQNYSYFIERVRESGMCNQITLAQNPAFVLGVNLLPFGETKKTLLDMIELRNRMKAEKEELSTIADRAQRQERAAAIKQSYERQILVLSEKVLADISSMLQYVCEGL